MAVTSTMLPLGTEAPEFSLPDTDGRMHSLSGHAAGNRGVLVAFICNHCPYVKHIRPVLAKRTADWIDRGVAVLAVNSNDAGAYPEDGPEAMAAEVVEHGYRFPYLIDEDQVVAAEYRAACTPDFFLFDADRKLVYRGQFDASRPSSGAPVTGDDLGAAVEALLQGAAISVEQRPSMGCSIKWKPGNEPEWWG